VDGSLERFVDPVDDTEWLVDLEFLGSHWTCIWDRGCQGILNQPAPELRQGCCSLGAELLDESESLNIAALAATLDETVFQYALAAAAGGVFADERRRATRIVDGACIFLNRDGFAGGAGCALHLGALADAMSPIDWKPSVCWQLPLKVERDGGGRATIRRWRRRDWGPGGAEMAWCCTEAPDAFIGDDRVVDGLAEELAALVGPEVAVAIRLRLDES